MPINNIETAVEIVIKVIIISQHNRHFGVTKTNHKAYRVIVGAIRRLLIYRQKLMEHYTQGGTIRRAKFYFTGS